MNKAVSQAELQLPAEQEKPSPRRRRPALVLGALAVIAAGGWYGHQWWQVGRFLESTDDAYVGGNVTSLAPRVAGHIEELLVTDNQHVTAGQLLLRLDPRPFQVAVEQAEASIRQRQAALANLQAQLPLQQSTIQQAEADLEAKNAAAVFAAQDAKRYQQLASSNNGSEQNAQKASATDSQARATVAAARAALTGAKQQLDVLNAQVTQATAAIAPAAADLDTARLNLGYTEIRAPLDGLVGNRAAQVGAYVSPGSYLLTIVPASGLWVDANFKEDQLRHVVEGQEATVTADIAPDQPLKGHVASLAPATGAIFSVIPPQNATGNFTKIVQRVPVRVVIDAEEARKVALRAGLSTVVTIDTRSH